MLSYFFNTNIILIIITFEFYLRVWTCSGKKINSTDINNIINNLLPLKQCIYLIIDDEQDNNDSNLEPLLLNLSFPTFKLTLEEFYQTNLSEKYNCPETGYIIPVNKYICTPDTLQWHNFKPDNKIVIIYDYQYDNEQNGCDLQLHEAQYQDLMIFLLNITRDITANTTTRWPPCHAQYNLLAISSIYDNLTINSTFLLQPENTYRMPKEYLRVKKPLQILIFELLPYVQIKNNETSGLEIEIITLLTKSIPIEFVIRPLFSWDDMLADVREHKADLAVTAIWQSRILNHDVEFLFPYMHVESTFLVPDATLLPPETFVFQALSTPVWFMTLLVLVLISQVIRIIGKYHERRKIDNYVMITVALYVINSTSRRAKTKLLRAVFVCWSLASLLLSTSYSAGFTSIENVPRTTKPVDTFKDAAARSLACHSLGDFTQMLLRQSEDIYKLSFAKKMMIHFTDVPPPGVCTGIDVLLNNYVFAGYDLSPTDLISLKVLKQNIQSTYNVFAIAKRSPYFQELNKNMIQLIENGFIKYLLMKNEDKALYPLKDFMINRFSSGGQSYKMVTMKDLQGVFYLLLVGYVLGMMHFCLEVYKHKKNLKT